MKQINSDDTAESEPMQIDAARLLHHRCCERRENIEEIAFQCCWPHMPPVDRLWRTVSTGIGNNNSQTPLRSIRLKAADSKGTQSGKHQFHSVPALLSSSATVEDDESHRCCSEATDCCCCGEEQQQRQPSNQDKENHFRPVYVIRPNHHIFGCASYEEEDPDEFFISSGCVRASCPNIYEATIRATSAASYGWQSCAELEHLIDDTRCQINSYQIDNYEMKVRNARLPRRNSEVSSTTTTTTATTISPSNELVFGEHGGGGRYNRHRSMAAVGLPPLRLPADDVQGQIQQREKALSLIVLARSQQGAERGWRRHRLGGRMRRWNQPLRSLDASSNLQWKSDTSGPAY